MAVDWNKVTYQQLLDLAKQQNPSMANGYQAIALNNDNGTDPNNGLLDLSGLGLGGKWEGTQTRDQGLVFSGEDPNNPGKFIAVRPGEHPGIKDSLVGSSFGGPGGVNVTTYSRGDTLLDKLIPIAVMAGTGAVGLNALGALGAASGAGAGAADTSAWLGAVPGEAAAPVAVGDLGIGSAGGLSGLGEAAGATGAGTAVGGGGAIGADGYGSWLGAVPGEAAAPISTGGLGSAIAGIPTIPTATGSTASSLLDKAGSKATDYLTNKGIGLLGNTLLGGTPQSSGGGGGGQQAQQFSALPQLTLKGGTYTPPTEFQANLPQLAQLQQVSQQGYAGGGLVSGLGDLISGVSDWFGGGDTPDYANSADSLSNVASNYQSLDTSDQGSNEWNKLISQNDTTPYGSVQTGDSSFGGLGQIWDTIKNADPKTIQMILGGVGLLSSLGKAGKNPQGIPQSLADQHALLSGMNGGWTPQQQSNANTYFNSPIATMNNKFMGTPAELARLPITSGQHVWYGHADGGIAGEGDPIYSSNSDPLPDFCQGGLNMMNGGHVNGAGDGQSDHINAMLSDGEFVVPADVVSSLGSGSTKAGAASLNQLLEAVRNDTRSAPNNQIPPKARSPLDYLKRGQ